MSARILRAFSSSSVALKKKGGKALSATSAASPSEVKFSAADLKKALDGTLRAFEDKVKEARSSAISTEKFAKLNVDLGHGSLAPLKSIATVAARGNKINIVAFDPNEVKRIQTAVISELGLPAELSSTDKQTLSVNVPQQTADKKAAMAKLVKDAYENLRNNHENRISVASLRAKYLNPLKKAAQKDSGVSKDEVKRQTNEIEQIVKTYGGKLQELFKNNS